MRGTKARAKFKPRRVQREDNRSDAGKISTGHGNSSRDKSRIKNPIESRRKRLFVEDEALRRGPCGRENGGPIEAIDEASNNFSFVIT